MKKKIVPIVMLAMTVLLFASCLNDDDQEEYDFYNDAAVTSFSLGEVELHLITKDSKGEDSAYVKKYTGSKCKFYIDQAKGQIYNPDSLPYGADAKHILATVGTKNGGVPTIKSVMGDEYQYLSSEDSIDYTMPRTLRVFSQSGAYHRDYTVTINVHQQIGDTLCWKEMAGNDGFKAFRAMKSVACGDNVYILGTDGQATYIYYMNRNNGTSWTPARSNLNMVFAADTYKNVVTKDSYVYLLNGNTLFRSTDAQNWSVVAETPLTSLAGATSTEMYGTTADGSLMVSYDNGASWDAEELDEDKALLPVTDFNCLTHSLKSDNGIDRVMLVGKDRNGTVRTWTKLIDHSGLNPKQYIWTYVDVAGDNRYALPAMDDLTVIDYDGNAVAYGKEDGGLGDFLVSVDGGITWKADKSYYYPKGFSGGTAFTSTADSDNFIWLVENTTGKVWRGRINRLGWKNDDKVFLK